MTRSRNTSINGRRSLLCIAGMVFGVFALGIVQVVESRADGYSIRVTGALGHCYVNGARDGDVKICVLSARSCFCLYEHRRVPRMIAHSSRTPTQMEEIVMEPDSETYVSREV